MVTFEVLSQGGASMDQEQLLRGPREQQAHIPIN